LRGRRSEDALLCAGTTVHDRGCRKQHEPTHGSIKRCGNSSQEFLRFHFYLA
jgi:hypothetical protein